MVSLESTYILEFGIKIKFFRFWYFSGSYRGLKFCEYSTVFVHIFRNFSKICLNYAEIVKNLLKFLMIDSFVFNKGKKQC